MSTPPSAATALVGETAVPQRQPVAVSGARGSAPSTSGRAGQPALRMSPAGKAKAKAKGGWGPNPAVIAVAASAGLVALAGAAIGLVKLLRRSSAPTTNSDGSVAGRWSRLKATSKCVPLEDGSACVLHRPIPADNSCLFNAIGYCMHKSKTRAPHLRNVVAQQVSGDKEGLYSTAFLGMPNAQYCDWIRQPMNWGGGIELSILAQGYGVEICTWNIESAKQHVFGEESGYKRQVMVIYNGVHYDALAIAQGPKANPEEDETSFNPRTKRGKMILAAAAKLTALQHKGSKFYKGGKKVSPPAPASGANAPSPPTANGDLPSKRGAARTAARAAAASGMKLRCGNCGEVLAGSKAAEAHAKATGHQSFEQVK